MNTLSSPSQLQCKNCGANLTPGQMHCTACGAPVVRFDNQAGLTAEMQAFIEAANNKLGETGTSSAEYGFGLGCSLFMLIVLAASLLAFFLSGRNWVVLGITAAGTAIAATAAAAFVATRARDASLQTTYVRVVRPEIEQFLKTYQISLPVLSRWAAEILPPNAPLLHFILPAATPGPAPTEE